MMSLNLRTSAVRLAVAAALAMQISAAHCEEVSVTIDNFTFEPAQLTVKAGTTVTWTNRDDIPHTVVSAGNFRSRALDTDDTYSFTFTSTGDYKYFCSLHPHMVGLIKVE
ncbi:MAG: blue (type 1) copper domain [Nitrobacter sp.]|uniref:cupredoxin domain-containing protein n=1 Tax=Nitrobacter sp. TaxID=29420 RepID=UPI00387DEC7A